MHKPKISVITVCYNAQNTIERCIRSVLNQNYPHVQYIIIDGGSTDNTLTVLEKYKNNIGILISEPDKGIYDAMNKGIALATGDIVGILNADDIFADDQVLNTIATAFENSHADVVYSDLDYINSDAKIVRKWSSGQYKKGLFNLGWMPPHPTFYCKRELFNKLGNYSLEYGTAADYELMLRFIHRNNARVFYIKKVLIKMAIGGISNKSITNRIKALLFDMKAMYNNNIYFPPITLLFKPLRKVRQFF